MAAAWLTDALAGLLMGALSPLGAVSSLLLIGLKGDSSFFMGMTPLKMPTTGTWLAGAEGAGAGASGSASSSAGAAKGDPL